MDDFLSLERSSSLFRTAVRTKNARILHKWLAFLKINGMSIFDDVLEAVVRSKFVLKSPIHSCMYYRWVEGMAILLQNNHPELHYTGMAKYMETECQISFFDISDCNDGRYVFVFQHLISALEIQFKKLPLNHLFIKSEDFFSALLQGHYDVSNLHHLSLKKYQRRKKHVVQVAATVMKLDWLPRDIKKVITKYIFKSYKRRDEEWGSIIKSERGSLRSMIRAKIRFAGSNSLYFREGYFGPWESISLKYIKIDLTELVCTLYTLSIEDMRFIYEGLRAHTTISPVMEKAKEIVDHPLMSLQEFKDACIVANEAYEKNKVYY